MSKFKQFPLATLLALLLITALAACGSPAAPAASSSGTTTETTTTSETASAADSATDSADDSATDAATGGKTLTIGSGSDILTLDPIRMVQVPDWPIGTAIYGGLVKYKPGLTAEIEPDLAESWEISEDGTVYTFHLRQGVQWQGGYGEFTAEDVKYSYDRAKDPDTGSAYLADLALLESIEVIDPYTVQFTFSAPYSPFLPAVAAFRVGRIVNQAAIEEFGDDYTSNAIGTGPYMLDHWTPGSEIVLTKNADYWDADNIKVDTIIYRIIPEPSVRILALQSGELDIVHPDDPDGISTLESTEGVVVQGVPGNNIIKLTFNTQNAPFDDPMVRKAVTHAIDRAAIAEFAMNGIASPAVTDIPPFMLGYTEDVTTYEYNPELARQMLAEAGYPDGIDMNIIVWDFGTYPRGGEALPAMLEEAGIRVNLEIVEGGQIQQRFADGTFDGAFFGSGRVDPHQVLYASFLSTSIPPNGQNRARYINPELDELLLEQAAISDPEARAAVIVEIQQLLNEEVPAVPIYVENLYVATRDYVTGALPASQYLLEWDMLDTSK